MKKLFAIYTIIGLLCVPFIFFNNAEGYRPAPSKIYQWSKATGGALYWPSYVFSIEPEVDSESVDSFQNSIIDIVNYRNDKFFTGKRNDSHGYMIFTAISDCLALEGADKDHILSLYKDIFSGNTNDKEIERIRSAVMKKMDGYDFADIVEAGAECGEDLEKSLASATVSALAEKLTSEPTSNNTLPVNPTPTSNSNATLEPSTQSEPNRVFEEAAKQTAIQYDAKWKAIKNNPTKFLNDCKSEGIGLAINLGETNSVEAEKQVEINCNIQLTSLKNCMDKPEADAYNCYVKVFETGD